MPQKKTLAGLGNDRDEAFPFWDHSLSELQAEAQKVVSWLESHYVKTRASLNFVVWDIATILAQLQNKVMLDSQSLLLNGEHFAVQHYNRNSTFGLSGNYSFSNFKSKLEMQWAILRITTMSGKWMHVVSAWGPGTHYKSWVYTKISIGKLRERGVTRINDYLLYSDCAMFFSKCWLTSWVSGT